jgi:valine--pyruvate aminotransferase
MFSGIRAIQKDTVETLQASGGTGWVNLSAGNPVLLPEVEAVWRKHARRLTDRPDFGEVLCKYGAPRGYEPFLDAVVQWFNGSYRWNISRRNVLVTPGSQALFFLAVNCFGGRVSDGRSRRVLMPLSPDYTGYAGAALEPDCLRAYRPSIEVLAPHRFRYRPALERLRVDRNVGAILFSRPCNPTGNVMADSEVRRVVESASAHDVPVIIDSAYAPPFPDLSFAPMTPVWGPNVVHCMSLSKVGLAGERIGVAIAGEDVIAVLEGFQSNANIHSSRLGQAIAAEAIASGELARLSQRVIKPHYRAKLARLETELDRRMPEDLPWYLHEVEGGMFAWLWFEDLPIRDTELYERIKRERVMVVPGSAFFPGSDASWPHQRQCIRLSLTGSEDDLALGAEAVAKVIDEVYRRARVGVVGRGNVG